MLELVIPLIVGVLSICASIFAAVRWFYKKSKQAAIEELKLDRIWMYFDETPGGVPAIPAQLRSLNDKVDEIGIKLINHMDNEDVQREADAQSRDKFEKDIINSMKELETRILAIVTGLVSR